MNDALNPHAALPEDWRKTRISVIFKSGDATLAKNYRPISVLPILYKIFSILIYCRLEPTLDAQQCKDQAGFRKGFSTVDHLFTASMIIDKANEWNAEVWLAAVDYTKAFDSVEHSSIWGALAEQNVPPHYIQLLGRLYSCQTGEVFTDCKSHSFDICRGTKQGDPVNFVVQQRPRKHHAEAQANLEAETERTRCQHWS